MNRKWNPRYDCITDFILELSCQILIYILKLKNQSPYQCFQGFQKRVAIFRCISEFCFVVFCISQPWTQITFGFEAFRNTDRQILEKKVFLWKRFGISRQKIRKKHCSLHNNYAFAFICFCDIMLLVGSRRRRYWKLGPGWSYFAQYITDRKRSLLRGLRDSLQFQFKER